MKVFAALSLGLAVSSAFALDDPIAYIQSELNAGKKNITVPAGVYKLSPREKENVYLVLKDLAGVTIDFSGVEFRGSVHTRMLEIENCSDLTLKGLTIDYDPLPYTQARIVEINAEKTWKLKVVDGYSTEGLVKTNGRIQVYGKDSLELVNPLRYQNDSIVKLADGTIEISGGVNRAGVLGDIVVINCFNAEKRKVDSVCSVNCKNLRVEGFTLYSSPDNFAFHEVGNERSLYLNCVVDRRAPESDYAKRGVKRLRSATADAFHCKDDPIGPQIVGCKARYQGDDCVNIAGQYCIVSKSENNELRVLTMGDKRLLPAGKFIQILSFDGQCPPDAKILSVEPDGACSDEEVAFLKTLSLWPGFYRSKGTAFRNALKVKVDRVLALQRGSMVISSSACGNGFLIKDCQFSDVRSRGLLIKASCGVIEGNTVANCWASALQVSPEYGWAEGGCSSDLKIENNTFSNGKGCPVWIGGFSGARTSLPANSHKNILIRGNTIKTGSCAIEVSGCSGLSIDGNTIETHAKRTTDAVRLKNVLDVKQMGNKIALLPLAKRDFRPRLVDVTVGGSTLYEDGKEARTLEIDSGKPAPFAFTFVNEGTEGAPCSAQMFIQFDAGDGKRLLDAGCVPSVSTEKWKKERQVVESFDSLAGLKGKVCKLYVGLYYAENSGERVTLANSSQGADLRLYVGTLRVGTSGK